MSATRFAPENLAIGALHLLGHRDITKAIRWAIGSMDCPSTIIKLITKS